MEGSVSEWIGQLKSGDADAAQRLWQRYAGQLVQMAERKLTGTPKGAADGEDIAQSVFGTICRGAAAGRFRDMNSRDDLWWLLLAITRHKAANYVRRETAQKRGTGRVHSETGLCGGGLEFSLDNLIGDHPAPDFLVMLDEEHQRLLGLLRDDRLRHVAISRIEGYTVAEIAAQLAISTRAVERKLQLIRNQWAAELQNSE